MPDLGLSDQKHGFAHLFVRSMLLLVLIPSLMAWLTAPASSQPLDINPGDVAQMVPGPGESGYHGPYGRWPSGADISVIVITDGQSSSCVDEAVGEIRRHWQLIRRDVSAFAKSPDVVVASHAPDHRGSGIILIELPTANKEVEREFRRFSAHDRRAGEVVEIDFSFSTSHGYRNALDGPEETPVYSFGYFTLIGVESDRIRFAYHWRENHRGISIFDPSLCAETAWAAPLYQALGAYNLELEPTNSLLRTYTSDRRYLRVDGFYRRLFLAALYSLPEKLDVHQLRAAYERQLLASMPNLKKLLAP